MTSDVIHPELARWATPKQREYLDAALKSGGLRAAARDNGWSYSAVRNAIANLRVKAATKGFSPAHDMVHSVPDPYVVKGVSTYYDKDGKPAGQWVKTRLDADRQREAMEAAAAVMAQEVPPMKPRAAPADTFADLANLYTFSDAHVGALAWAKETGADWDLKIGERTLTMAMGALIAQAPAAQTAIVANLGDFLHFDSLESVTPTNRNQLDADGRFSKVVAVAIRVLRAIISMALSKHERVVVLMAEGNHDLASAVWLRHMFSALYEQEPRVTVVRAEQPYYVVMHGRTMLGFHHGHLTKPASIAGVMAAKFPREWGDSDYRYVHMGHLHHINEKENNGVTVVQHATISAPDAYSTRRGWVASRQITSITYHKRFGQVARNTVVPEMLEGA